MAAHCATGQQAYWVCPLIEESELVDSQAATALESELAAALPKVRIGLVHGRMKSAEKDAVMRAFKSGALDLLVATTVIEVGVDVPNATLMVVENAERMGLAQLHQLRGRVGRGHQASTCVLLYKPPLSPLARERLNVLRATNDGFEVAQKDLAAARSRRGARHAPDRHRAAARGRPAARRRSAADRDRAVGAVARDAAAGRGAADSALDSWRGGVREGLAKLRRRPRAPSSQTGLVFSKPDSVFSARILVRCAFVR